MLERGDFVAPFPNFLKSDNWHPLMNLIIKLIGLLVMALVISSCQPAPTPYLQTPAQTQASGYPLPSNLTAQPAYPFSAKETQPESSVESESSPTPNPEAGRVSGRILRGKDPAGDITLYLAEVLKDSQGNELIASFSKADSPRTNTDPEGYFTFINIAPGKYGLVLDTVVDSYLLHYPDNDKEIIIAVEKGKEVNIGEISYDTLPLPQP
ncbi:MAG: hypothetical protein P8Y14_26120 [Anaerolineales bacterium]|jgi:hypothetical protein